MNSIPIIGWNRSGRIGPPEIALSLAIAESEEEGAEDLEEAELTHGGVVHGHL